MPSQRLVLAQAEWQEVGVAHRVSNQLRVPRQSETLPRPWASWDARLQRQVWQAQAQEFQRLPRLDAMRPEGSPTHRTNQLPELLARRGRLRPARASPSPREPPSPAREQARGPPEQVRRQFRE